VQNAVFRSGRPRTRRQPGLAGAALLAFCALLLPLPLAAQNNLATLAQSAKSARLGPFGGVEFASSALDALPQWNRILVRAAAEMPAFEACVADRAQCKSSGQTVWREAIEAGRKLPRLERIDHVNRFFNRFPYRDDVAIHGVTEYWATPQEFLAKSGDCEDFAIAKYYALRALGFRADELRVVVIRDRIRGIGHAVLAAYIEGDILILDNLSNVVLSHSLYEHYSPQYSVNESARWLHVPPGAKTAAD
jgi:predicted transglutaminase-like cysteine proteinase